MIRLGAFSKNCTTPARLAPQEMYLSGRACRLPWGLLLGFLVQGLGLCLCTPHQQEMNLVSTLLAARNSASSDLSRELCCFPKGYYPTSREQVPILLNFPRNKIGTPSLPGSQKAQGSASMWVLGYPWPQQSQGLGSSNRF